ncbi:MAG: DUF6950 family protein [Hoeflea sp.]|uniref:DUF6950 family protein n=1 Tax=Hoeflea sp. TaxID=1940281 RepID=UPI003EFAC044
MRVGGWEKRLKAAVERHRDLPGQWDVSDCWVLARDACKAVTGKDLAPHLRGYKTEKAGYRLFARHGFKTVGEALAAHLPECPVLMAQRGDLGVVERGGLESCGVVTATGVAVKTLYDDGTAQLEYHPVTALTRAFKVS